MNFDILLQIVISSIAATSLMTLFSYVVSASARELYKEPVLLTYILTFLGIEAAMPVKIILAWLLHYLIGLAFVVAYHYLWVYDVLEMSCPVAFLLGSISGIIGILGWIVMFTLSSKKPNIDFQGYYLQLFVAHVIFGIAAFAVYKIFI
ncbi:hypothetical protein [Flavobacterium sp.]|uniref:hypothetical protein n=1 Tax=Flavobacterium sp. TaxID=239 RepID=UPI0032676A9D